MALARIVTGILLVSAVATGLAWASPQDSSPAASPTVYAGFDRNDYPGDAAIPVLRKSFAFTGYWLSAPPGGNVNTWSAKRQLLESQGFGFLLLYAAPPATQFNDENVAGLKGILDANNAAASANKEGFRKDSVIFLDIEEGGRLPEPYHAYLRAWMDQLKQAGYRAGVYCSGMPVSEGHGVTIVTADDIRNHLEQRDVAYWVYNDACPPSPGCALRKNLPLPSSSGVSYASVWQISQSPRRKEFTARCAATYDHDGNCYALGDAAHAWFLDVNVALTSDPSHTRN